MNVLITLLLLSIINNAEDNIKWERFQFYRNFNETGIEITSMPGNVDETDYDLFDVLAVKEHDIVQLDSQFGDIVGRVLMPKYWESSYYYCCGRISVIDGVDSFVIYVSNYCRSDLPFLFLLNIKDNILKSVLKLSMYEDGGYHCYASYTSGMFVLYESTVFVEEESSINRPYVKSELYHEESHSYKEVGRILIDDNGFFYAHTNLVLASCQSHCSLPPPRG